MGGDDTGNGRGLANLSRFRPGHDTWGRMTYLRGIVVHHISPFEQRTFAGYFSKGIPNTIRRIRSQVFKIGIPVIIGLMIYNWAEKEHTRLIRKDPKVYEDEYKDYLASDEYKSYLENKEALEKEAQRSVKK